MLARPQEVFEVDRNGHQQGAQLGDRPGDPGACDSQESAVVNSSVLQNEMTAEVFPLDRAVKKPEDVIFSPLNRKLTAKSLKPATARA